jgi:hypothetical protein
VKVKPDHSAAIGFFASPPCFAFFKVGKPESYAEIIAFAQKMRG